MINLLLNMKHDTAGPNFMAGVELLFGCSPDKIFLMVLSLTWIRLADVVDDADEDDVADDADVDFIAVGLLPSKMIS